MILQASLNSRLVFKRTQKGRDQRNAHVKRIGVDIKKIVDEECAYSKSLLRAIIPVDIAIDKDARGLHALFPLKVTVLPQEASLATMDDGYPIDDPYLS